MTEAYEIRGDGYLEYVAPGVWDCYFSLGKDPKTGKYLRSAKRRFHCKNKTEAKRMRAAYKRELEENRGRPIEDCGLISFAQKVYTKKPLTPRAEQRRKLSLKHIEGLFGDCGMRRLTSEKIRRVYNRVRSENLYSESELHVIDMRLRELFRKALAEGIVSKNPMDDVDKPCPERKEPKRLTERQISEVKDVLRLSALDSNTVGLWLAANCGMRVGEIMAANWDEIDLDRRILNVRWQYTTDCTYRRPKSRASLRTIPLNSEITEVLTAWRDDVETTFGSLPEVKVEALDGDRKVSLTVKPVIFDSNLNLYDPSNFERWFRDWSVEHGFGTFKTPPTRKTYIDKQGRKYSRRVQGKGYEGITMHSFRRGLASSLAKHEVPRKTTQDILGHTDWRTTDKYYVFAEEEDARKAVEDFERNTK